MTAGRLSCLATLLLTATLAAANVRAQSGEPEGILQVEITGLHGAEGDVYIAVYDSASAWLGENAVLTRRVDIAASAEGEVVAAELLLPLGTYAFAAWLDRDGDGRLGTNILGAPDEPFAISNNANQKFIAPRYADAAFELGLEPVQQRVVLRSP